MHAFSHTPTQYEIESWMFPHPGVRRLQDASNSGPQRHSLHFVTPLTKGSKEREERARLKKGHRRWHSNEHQILHSERRGSKENKSRGGGLRIGISEPEHDSSAIRLPPEGDDRSRGDVTISQDRRCHSQGHPKSVLAGEALNEEEVEGLSRVSGSVKSRRGRVQSRLCGSPYGMPSQIVSDRWGRDSGVDVGVRPSELLGAPVPPSPRPHKRPWVSQLSAPLPSTGHTSHATQTQQQRRPPSYSHRQQAASLEFHSVELKTLLWSLSCGSWTMGAESVPLGEGLGESCFSILRLAVTNTHTKPPLPSICTCSS